MSERRDLNFGQEFEQTQPDREVNRMDVLHPIEHLPESVKFARELREDLKSFVEAEGWPECPENIASVEDLFAVGRAVVTECWKQSAGKRLAKKCRSWAKQIDDKDEEGRAAKQLLQQPAKLEEALRIQQLGALETIREEQPEAWRTLVMVSSERQLAVLALVRHWVKEQLSDEQLEKTGFNRDEVELFLDFSAVLGKYIDHAYVKQIEIADIPGGQDATPLDKQHRRKTGEDELGGAEYLYDYRIVPEGQKNSVIRVKTYSEVFPFEWPKIVSRIEALARRTGSLLEQGRLPEKYQGLSEYLQHVAELYGSDMHTAQGLDDLWEKLYDEGAKLAEQGCPLMLIAQGNTGSGEADKVDVELRFGLQTSETRATQGVFRKFGQIARQLNKQYADSLDELPPAQKIVLNTQPLAFGPNLYWMTRGETSETKVVIHADPVVKVAAMKELPLLEKLKLVSSADAESYKMAALTETVLHEFGHTVMPTEDEQIEKRIGSYDAIDELKADTVGILLFAQGMEQYSTLKKIAERQLIAKLGTIATYLTSKSSKANSDGEPYYLAGAAQLIVLLDRGALQEIDGRYVITDAKAGIEVLANLGSEILSRFYVDKTSTPEAVAEYFEGLRSLKQDPRLKRFVSTLRD
ncbi:hypothetical protein JXA59_03170 [Patescibacteria group bacterium]|nr:hypothetical protein [Patescibacteria group bacterium]